MKRITTVLLALLAISIISAGVALAYGPGFGSGASQGNGTHYEDMQDIMANGTYSDLVEYRQASGFNAMPWVQDEADFSLAQQMHSRMVQSGKASFPNGQGFGRHSGCPMMNYGG